MQNEEEKKKPKSSIEEEKTGLAKQKESAKRFKNKFNYAS